MKPTVHHFRPDIVELRMRWWLLVSLFLTGCLVKASNECPGGGICPAGLKCVVEDGKQHCISPNCGNNVLDEGEACDDGNNLTHDSCPLDCTAAPKPTWSSLTLAPPPRTASALAYDAIRGRVVMFGGCSALEESSFAKCSGTLYDDTWEWDGSRWEQVAKDGLRPSGRLGAAMTFDAARGRVVMFGGCAGQSSIPTGPPCTPEFDTWEWDGIAWTRRNPGVFPPAQFDAAMVYDGARRVVLMAGCPPPACGPNEVQTWEWNGDDWRKLPSIPAGQLFSSFAMAFDPVRGVVVAFGGASGIRLLDETWEWDGVAWTLRTPLTRPPARFDHAMTYDPIRQTVIMFGGCTDSLDMVSTYQCNTRASDTWEWNGTTWARVSTSHEPHARNGHKLVYDARRDRVVMFGGDVATGVSSADSWEFDHADWSERQPRLPSGRSLHGTAFDSARGTTVIFGGQDSRIPYNLRDTWEWDGSAWTSRSGPSPSSRSMPAMTYDPLRERVVLFGGCVGVGGGSCEPNAETWELSAAGWSQRNPSTSPPIRMGGALTFDRARGRVVLFGGCGAIPNTNCDTPLADTWEWDGATWTQRISSTTPPARWLHALAYDTTRSRVVAFGGADGAATRNDVWEWDGADWQARSPTTAPPPRAMVSAAFDADHGEFVVHGGCSTVTVDYYTGARCRTTVALADTWTWNGMTWSARSNSGPTARAGHALSFDTRRHEVVFFAGYSIGDTGAGEIARDTWAWDGSAWSRRSDEAVPSSFDHAPALTYDALRGRIVSFNGRATWEWDGVTWSNSQPTPSPPHTGPITYDLARAETVLFVESLGDGNETWTWNGSAWHRHMPAAMPPPRARSAIAYDAARSQVVLFGGDVREIGEEAQTWLWDGINWTLASTATSPPTRSGHALAYDAHRGRVVLFGGGLPPMKGGGSFADTWEWDGVTWVEKHPVTVPPPREGHVMIYDAERRRVRMSGGAAGYNDAWEWDGTNWTQVDATDAPAAREEAGAAYDVARRETMIAFGFGPFGLGRDDIWLVKYQAPPSEDRCESGFGAEGEPRAGCLGEACIGLCDPTCAAFAVCDGERAMCGDAACSPLESCMLCPEDCGECSQCGDFHCSPGETCAVCPGDCGACS